MRVTADNVHEIFRYVQPCLSEVQSIQAVRESAEEFAKTILDCVPAGADQQAAIRKVREAVWTANAGVVLKDTV